MAVAVAMAVVAVMWGRGGRVLVVEGLLAIRVFGRLGVCLGCSTLDFI